ncbi:zinc-ribbon domain-containing protein [Companilactobacillus heilongjiangensis]|uniref:Zinc-ribbon domain-containing protein n=1 Tax=Companilactobacillus heilongjiangensis TaxID=1074467 RepID=A0A0K2LAZ3_9LACO|nr:zinc-ribbon domain-containing protein [Companilactobacillus heilongjiangensis]ALB28477.1 hypothetical protein JP39_03370 [Companilactobacillus heilongjiangensis]
MKFCTNCGFKMNDDVEFCPKCGTKQVIPDLNNNGSNSNSSSETHQVDNQGYVDEQSNTQQAGPGINNNYQRRNVLNSKIKIGQPKHLNFMESVSYIFSNMFDFSSTVQDNQKSIFWWNYLLITIVSVVLTPTVQSIGYIEYLVFNSGIMLFTVASIMRRLNYLGKSKELAWLALVPVAVIYPLIMMFFNKKEDSVR